VKKEMFTLTKKQKLLIASATALALVFVVAFPYAYASSASTTAETPSNQTRMLRAKGIALEKTDGQLEITSAGFALTLEATEVNETIIKFNVVGGTVKINGTEYMIIEGKGAVIRDKHGFLMQATGTSADGQPVTLKLAGRYFWMWGHLYAARLLGSLQTENAKTLLVLRSVIRV
jgi:cytochrome oxidase Cu insertion factor (SCO1/SenC/PrrC family)